jgi:hypothetical protein
MPALDELQRLMRNAVVASEFDAVRPLLLGGSDPAARLAIHRRHYHASLTETLHTRFPATAWLVGDAIVLAAARDYVAHRPPRVFCMAEFGEDFPAFLSTRPGLEELPYLQAFGELEWRVGQVSVAVDAPPQGRALLTDRDPEALMASSLQMQPGLVYLSIAWPVDELMHVYLSEEAPPRFQMEATRAFVEIRGARGDVQLSRLGAGDWEFRHSLQAGQAIEEAATHALDADQEFDPGQALVAICDAGLVTGLRGARDGDS